MVGWCGSNLCGNMGGAAGGPLSGCGADLLAVRERRRTSRALVASGEEAGDVIVAGGEAEEEGPPETKDDGEMRCSILRSKHASCWFRG